MRKTLYGHNLDLLRSESDVSSKKCPLKKRTITDAAESKTAQTLRL